MNAQHQEDEVEALKAIYDTDFATTDEQQRVYSITIHFEDDENLSMELSVIFPEDYPSNSPPVFEIKNAQWLENRHSQNIAENLTRIFSENKGEVVVYQWIEWIKDFVDKLHIKCTEQRPRKVEHTEPLSPNSPKEESSIEDDGCQKRFELGEVSVDGVANIPEIFHGEPLTDRKSTFQAHVAQVTSRSEVKSVLQALKTNRKIATATHNILAYRLFDSSRNVFQQDCDDDGEHAAGSRLLHLLQIMDIRNAMVVVTRWYGGILLHADRFKHINNVARILLQETAIGQKKKGSERNKGKLNKSHKTAKVRSK